METYLHYISGETIQAGDRVQHGTEFATVVFVSDGTNEDFAPGYEDYTGTDPGVMVCDDDGGLKYLPTSDDRLAFVERG